MEDICDRSHEELPAARNSNNLSEEHVSLEPVLTQNGHLIHPHSDSESTSISEASSNGGNEFSTVMIKFYSQFEQIKQDMKNAVVCQKEQKSTLDRLRCELDQHAYRLIQLQAHNDTLKAQLKQHNVFHEGFTCDRCWKKFATKQTRAKHMKNVCSNSRPTPNSNV